MYIIEGKAHIPKDTKSNPLFIVPDEVIKITAKKLGLNHGGLRGIDPACGVGTIPRVITQIGGSCDGIEIDSHQYNIAVREAKNSNVILGDFTKAESDKYNYIYTSLPFTWFKNEYPLTKIATALKSMLTSDGKLIIDSTDIANRNAESWPLANVQAEYFKKHGFKLDQTLTFTTTKRQDMTDNIFLELVFSLK
ncbi:MAG TPA: hypothetical protein VLA77_02580 [Candidatus Saccharimonadales bacterium]|nr:hypothetical protein [Candidatus Saccharimonadales bacterium]